MVWKESILAKLHDLKRGDLMGKTANCHMERSVRQCLGCAKKSIFWNRCEVKWCPVCAGRLASERKQSVEWWTKLIDQPKHVVLTTRNSEAFTKAQVTKIKEAFTKLRRSKFAANWKGGFYSLEVTNEGRGWHLHIHALVDARFIAADELARQWAKHVGQEMAIVKVKDCRDKSYLQEVTKYAVKGSELASWSGEEIVQFIESMQNVRTFGVFGSLYGKRTEWKEFLDQLRQGRIKCECGCDRWKVMSEKEFDWKEIERELAAPRPPPGPEQKFRTGELAFKAARGIIPAPLSAQRP